MLISATQGWIDIPHEPGERAEIRALSWKERREAQMANQGEVMKLMQSLNADIVKMMREMSPETTSQDAERRQEGGYDIGTVLRAGLIRISYVENLTPEVIDDLDGETAEFLARAIWTRSTRSAAEGKALYGG